MMVEEKQQQFQPPFKLTIDQFWQMTKIAAVLGVLFLIYANRQPLFEILSLVGDQEALVIKLQQYGALGPLLLSATIFLQVIVAAIPGHLLMVTGGYIYGFTEGFLLAWVSTIVASELTFYLARRYGRPVVDRLADTKLVDRWVRLADRQGFTFFLAAFMIPVFPADVMSYVAGLSKISPRSYLAANLIGRLPAAILMTLVGSHGLQITLPVWLLVIGISIVMVYIFHRMGKRIEAQLEKAQEVE